MKDRIEAFLAAAVNKDTRDINELKDLYVETGHELGKCESETCITKMINAIRKYYALNFEVKKQPFRKYTLKPGNHSFAPNGPATHNNDNTSSKQIEHYLKAYPHIKSLLKN